MGREGATSFGCNNTANPSHPSHFSLVLVDGTRIRITSSGARRPPRHVRANSIFGTNLPAAVSARSLFPSPTSPR